MYTLDFDGNVQAPVSFTSIKSARRFAATLLTYGRVSHIYKRGALVEVVK